MDPANAKDKELSPAKLPERRRFNIADSVRWPA